MKPRDMRLLMEKTGKPHIHPVGGGRWWIYKNCPPQPGQPAKFHSRAYPSFASLLEHEPLPQ